MNAIGFSLLVNDANADNDGYLPSTVYLDWLSSFEWRHSGLIVTHSFGPLYLLHFSGRCDCPRFCAALGTRSWLLGNKRFLLPFISKFLCPPSIDLETLRARAKVVLRDHISRLLSFLKHGMGS